MKLKEVKAKYLTSVGFKPTRLRISGMDLPLLCRLTFEDRREQDAGRTDLNILSHAFNKTNDQQYQQTMHKWNRLLEGMELKLVLPRMLKWHTKFRLLLVHKCTLEKFYSCGNLAMRTKKARSMFYMDKCPWNGELVTSWTGSSSVP